MQTLRGLEQKITYRKGQSSRGQTRRTNGDTGKVDNEFFDLEDFSVGGFNLLRWAALDPDPDRLTGIYPYQQNLFNQ